MKFLPDLLCLCLLCLFGKTFCDEKGSAVIYVDEGRDVTLPCSLGTKENIESNLFDWRKDDQMEVFTFDRGFHYNNGRSGQSEQFKVRVFHFPDELKYGNASILIRNVKVADSGDYTCDFPFQQKRDKIHIKLVVVASPEPYVTTLGQAEDRVLLQCEVRGASPEPRVDWQDSAGNILPIEETLVSERGGHFYIALQTTVTKTDHYRCVVTQEEINHVTDAMTYVPVCDTNATIRARTVFLVVYGILTFIMGAVVIVIFVKRRQNAPGFGVLDGKAFQRKTAHAKCKTEHEDLHSQSGSKEKLNAATD